MKLFLQKVRTVNTLVTIIDSIHRAFKVLINAHIIDNNECILSHLLVFAKAQAHTCVESLHDEIQLSCSEHIAWLETELLSAGVQFAIDTVLVDRGEAPCRS